mmetsp:Transcript_38384/g.151637  ORF Transcript_38384/g.151637 Transcript_38384/m.151637 type:complete len:94 (+) Transcript_38384:305-586(+)
MQRDQRLGESRVVEIGSSSRWAGSPGLLEGCSVEAQQIFQVVEGVGSLPGNAFCFFRLETAAWEFPLVSGIDSLRTGQPLLEMEFERLRIWIG